MVCILVYVVCMYTPQQASIIVNPCGGTAETFSNIVYKARYPAPSEACSGDAATTCTRFHLNTTTMYIVHMATVLLYSSHVLFSMRCKRFYVTA